MKRTIELSRAPRRGALHRLTDREVRSLGNGMHGDGGGLTLRVEGDSRRWYFRYQKDRKAQYVPLGSLADRTLKQARELAAECRRQIADNKSPKLEWEARAQAQEQAELAAHIEAERSALTLEKVATDYHAAHLRDWTHKHGAQWLSSLKLHVFPRLGAKPIADIRPADLLAVLQPLRAQIPETATRIRERLDAIFADAILREQCEGNPAAAIAKALRGKRVRVHHAAMDYAAIPAFIARLRKFERISYTTALALEFLILTASRTAEVIGAKWSEVDEKARTWTIPAARMKAREPHTVYLSDRAMAILKEARPYDGENLLFPSAGRAGHPLSNMAFLATLKRMGLWGPDAEQRVTAHGFRAAFSTWANEQHWPRDVTEAALAHSETDQVRRAYNRAQYIEQRKALSQAWSDHCAGKRPRKAGKPALRVVRAA
ncbi:putative prophage CPZ-55 integrase [Burkholderiales bacterium]|nr:putative prophage CPZ-55 integrase [Burkholderiales bacterium]